MRGELFLYEPEKLLCAFQSEGDGASVLVLLGGLGDGFLFDAALAEALDTALRGAGWTLLQPLLSSSYAGWGTSCLASDCAELERLLLRLQGRGAQRIVLLGHSTGCQDTVYLLRHSPDAHLVTAAILQAPVSDREYFAQQPETAGAVAAALALVAAGTPAALLPCAPGDVPITAARTLALKHEVTGDEDVFSSDLSASQLEAALGHMAVPVLLAVGTRDACYPPHVDPRALVARLRGAMTRAPFVETLVTDGQHTLAGEALARSTAAVVAFLARLP